MRVRNNEHMIYDPRGDELNESLPVVSGQTPYAEHSDMGMMELLNEVLEDGLRPTMQEDCHPTLLALINEVK